MTVAVVDRPIERDALLSKDRVYRYGLARIWDRSLPACAFVLLNPSTADEYLDDPTIRRCMGFARQWGHGALIVVNIFGLRSTDPRALRKAADPVGPANDDWLLQYPAMFECKRYVFAWGSHGELHGRGDAVLRLFRPCGDHYVHLGLTGNGQPKHPLYLRGDVTPTRYEWHRKPTVQHEGKGGGA